MSTLRRSSCQGAIRPSTGAKCWTWLRRAVPSLRSPKQLGVTGQTIYNWRNQDLADRGLRPGVSTAESAELAVARRRIHELETELAVTKRAFELLVHGRACRWRAAPWSW